jgi:hypothetical protein
MGEANQPDSLLIHIIIEAVTSDPILGAPTSSPGLPFHQLPNTGWDDFHLSDQVSNLLRSDFRNISEVSILDDQHAK